MTTSVASVPRLSLVTAPTVEPISLEQAKLHLKVDDGVTEDDALIEDVIVAAREAAENLTGRQFITATYDQRFDGIPPVSVLELAKPNLLTVTSVTYVDSSGAHVWGSSNYTVDAPAGPKAPPGRLRAAYGTVWPTTQVDTLNALVIRTTNGYGPTAASVPRAIRQAMLLMIGHWYLNREAVLVGVPGINAIDIPMTANSLLRPYRVYS